MFIGLKRPCRGKKKYSRVKVDNQLLKPDPAQVKSIAQDYHGKSHQHQNE
jgi:hypothetical protein